MLGGITVLDMSRVLAGPYAGQLLADLGARVIKVEALDGDGTRSWGPPWAGGASAYFLSANRGKESVAVNLKQASGAELVMRLAERCDVLIENFMVGTLRRFGLGYEDLRERNPGLVYCSITGYGQTGPRSNEPGYDAALQAETGLQAMTGEPGGAPVKLGVAWIDVLTGTHAATAILAALVSRSKTGAGQQLDIALYDVAINALVNQAQSALVTGEAPARLGSAHPSIVPYQTFASASVPVVIAVGTDRQFAEACSVLGLLELASDERYATNPARVAHRAELVALIGSAVASWEGRELVERLIARKVPASVVADLTSALNAANTVARGLVEPATVGGDPVALLAGAFRHRRGSGEWTLEPTVAPPPALGQHTSSVLTSELGLSATEIAELEAAGAIRCA